MTLVCSKCGYQFVSFIIDKHVALKELEDKIARHTREKHPEIFAGLAVAIQKACFALASLMQISEMIMIPEQETFVEEIMEERKEIVMLGLGYDPAEDAEEEDEDEEEVIEVAPEPSTTNPDAVD